MENSNSQYICIKGNNILQYRKQCQLNRFEQMLKTIVETHHAVKLPKKYLFANDYNKDDTSNDNISDNTKW